METDPYSVTDAIFWGNLVQQAYVMFETPPASLTPPWPPTPANPGLPAGWQLAYYLFVADKVLVFEQNASIGYILQSTADGSFGIVFRGTDKPIEWVIDFEVDPTAFIVNGSNYGQVESGFLGELDNVKLKDPSGNDIGPFPQWLATLTGTGVPLVFAGHSLGAALAALAGAQSALQGNPTRIYTYALPQIGDAHFATSFNGLRLDHYRIYNIHDIVPNLPAPGYCQVEIGIPIDTTTKGISTSPRCCHSLCSYLAVLGSSIYQADPACL